MRTVWVIAFKAVFVFCAILAAQAFASPDEIHGAGATFPAPVYAQWAEAYRRETGLIIRYDAIGSGQGLDLIRARRVDFGASDVPLSHEDLEKYGLVEFPAVIGGVVPVVNLHGIGAGELKLSGEVLSAIFSGRITRWNDPAIVALNPSLPLPGSRITVVHRTDASGTSFLWTGYLSAQDPRWQRDIGRGTTVDWPAGVGGVGNEGVASYVQRTRASIGYVEYAYAKEHRLSDVSLRDANGTYIRADATAFAAALVSSAGGARQADDATSLLEPTGRGWPITGPSYILIAAGASDAAIRRDVLDFFCWALRNGQPLARKLHYVPIPDESAKAIVDALIARKP